MYALRFAWVGPLLVLGLQAAPAQDDEETSRAAEGGPERCISLNRVERSEIVDDRTLVFHMRDGALFLNHLERECPGLKREERFMYSPTSNRLCSIDAVTVIEDWGFGLTRGFTCTLGPFHPITAEDLEELKRSAGDDGPRERGGDIEVEVVDPDELAPEQRSDAAE